MRTSEHARARIATPWVRIVDPLDSRFGSVFRADVRTGDRLMLVAPGDEEAQARHKFLADQRLRALGFLLIPQPTDDDAARILRKIEEETARAMKRRKER